jgi:hypothetical protein
MFGAARLGLFNANPTGGKAYFCGGFIAASSAVVRTYNIATGVVYTSTTTGNGNMPSAVFVTAGFGNQTYGFNVGGYSGSAPVNTSRYILFASDAGSGFTWTTTATLPGTQRNQRGTSSSTKGYSWAGFRDGTGDLTVNWQLTYSALTWSTGTALPLTGSPIAGGFEALHCNATQALWIGGQSDSGTARKQQLSYVFATDATTYTQTGAANFFSVGGATGDQTNMIAVSGLQTSGAATLTTNVNKYNIVSGAATTTTNVPTAFRNTDSAGNDYVGITAASQTGGANPTPAQTEGAYTYSSDTYVLLTAYLNKVNIYTTRTESVGAFSSTQTS